ADGYRAQQIGGQDFARQVLVFETVGGDDLLVGDEFAVFAAERMFLPVGEVDERNAKAASDACVELVHDGGEAIRRIPLGQGGRVDQGAVNPLGRGAEDTDLGQGVRHG